MKDVNSVLSEERPKKYNGLKKDTVFGMSNNNGVCQRGQGKDLPLFT